MIATGGHRFFLSESTAAPAGRGALCGQRPRQAAAHAAAASRVTELPDCQAVACGDVHTVALTAEQGGLRVGLSRGPPTSRKATPKQSGLTASGAH